MCDNECAFGTLCSTLKAGYEFTIMRREKIAKKGKIITNKMQNLEIFLARLAIYQISKVSRLKVVQKCDLYSV